MSVSLPRDILLLIIQKAHLMFAREFMLQTECLRLHFETYSAYLGKCAVVTCCVAYARSAFLCKWCSAVKITRDHIISDWRCEGRQNGHDN